MLEIEIQQLLETNRKCVSEQESSSVHQQPINPISELLSTLSPGKELDQFFINATRESVDAFVSYDAATGLATFIKSKGHILVADASRIDALDFT